MILTTLLFAVAIAGTGYSPAPPDNVYISPTGSDTTGTGAVDKPYQTIMKGINSVDNAGTVHLAKGTYNKHKSDTTKDYDISIDKDVTISGAGKDKTFIDAKGLETIFTIDNFNKVTIQDLTLMNGNSLDVGSAVLVGYDSQLNIKNCNLKNNKVQYGGGGAIFNEGITTVTNCVFTGNKATEGFGGAICGSFFSTLKITGSTFNRNSALYGGAMFLLPGMYDIISNNFLNSVGNGIEVFPIPFTKKLLTEPEFFYLNINFNRFMGNTDYGLYIMDPEEPLLFAAAGDEEFYPIDATNNWWGSNNDPRTLSDAVHDPDNYADTEPWLVLSIMGSPTKILYGSTSKITADIIHNNLGKDTSNLGHIPNGTPITITTDIGNVGSKSVLLYTFQGVVSTILRADDGTGTAHLYAFSDGFRTLLAALVVIYPIPTPKPTPTPTPSPTPTPKAAGAVTAKVQMQETGVPIQPVVLALLLVLVGFAGTRRK